MSLTPPVSHNDHNWGNENASIVLVEYGDFQCPYCGKAYPIVKRLKAELNSYIRFVFRNFPLTKIHPQAKSAAIAAEASGLQNKFWEMHDLLFENQRHLNDRALISYAEMINLDMEKFKYDLHSSELSEKVDRHFMSGLRSGVNATPTFFINEIRYKGSWEYDDLSAHLRQVVASVM